MHSRNIREHSDSRCKCIGNTQAEVVVAVVGVVVVAISNPAVLSVVVPAPAAFDTVGGANGLYPKITHHIVSGVSSKLLRNLFRKFHVSYWHKWAMMLVALCKNCCCSINPF